MHLLLLFLTTLIAGMPLSAQVLITGVTVVDVEQKKIIKSQNVLVERGVITAIGAKIAAPAGIQRINGKGKYLVPGFVDTHIHFFQSGGIYTRPDVYDLRKFSPYSEEIAWTHNNMENQLRRYTSAGITSVVDVGSTINFLVLLSKNPLSSLENWETVDWVFVRGHAWKPADLLKHMLIQ